jgi:CcmD family protein
MPWNRYWNLAGARDERKHPMSGIAMAFPANEYLFAAYAATWIIHIVYLGTIVSRYSRLRREIDDLKKPDVRKAGVRF